MDISVVVCTYNKKELLLKALDSLTRQETEGQLIFEIIIIDDGSTDNTRDVVKEFIRNNTSVAIRYVYKTGGGVADARNAGVAEAHGKWVAFFDDDQWAEPQWLGELYRVGMEKSADCVGGTVLLDLPDSSNLKLSMFCRGLLAEKIFGDKSRSYSIKARYVGLETNNVLVRRKLFERIGVFDASFLMGGEDVDFFWRARKHGAEAWYAPKAVVHHIIPEHRLRDEYFTYVSLRNGVGGARILYKHRGRLRCLPGLVRRILRNFARYVWLLLTSLILGNKHQQLERNCRLSITVGYIRGSLFFFAPRLFKQRKFFESLNFRSQHR